MDKAQTLLATDQLNLALYVKFWTKEVVKNSEIEENSLQLKAKGDWTALGDGNNAYFYAKLKAKK